MTPPNPSPDQPAADSQVDLILLSLDLADADIAVLSAHLSPDEHERSRRLLCERDRRRYVTARGQLREILGGYLATQPAEIRFRYGERGKPYLAPNQQLFFNLSHSADLAAIAISRDFEVGVDIERLRPVRRDLPKRYFSPREAMALDALEGDAWQIAFFRCWTRKEAFIKALGEGMRQPLKSFSVTLSEQPRLEWLADDANAPQNWTFFDVAPAAGFIGAVAVKTCGAPAPHLQILSRIPPSPERLARGSSEQPMRRETHTK